MASIIGLGKVSIMASMDGSPAKAEYFAVTRMINNSRMPHQINKDFRLAFISCKKIFIPASLRYHGDIAPQIYPVTASQCHNCDGNIEDKQWRIVSSILHDGGRVQVLEWCDVFQLDLAKHTGEGSQHIGAKAQSQRIRGDTAHALDQQGNNKPDTHEKELQEQHTDQQQDQSPGLVFVAVTEDRYHRKTDHPDHQFGDCQAAQGSQQFAGEQLCAADRFAEQEIRCHFVLFNRDQPKAVIASLNCKAQLDEGKDERVESQHCGHVNLVHAEGFEQGRGIPGQQLVHQGSLRGEGLKDGTVEEYNSSKRQRPDQHRS